MDKTGILSRVMTPYLSWVPGAQPARTIHPL